MVTVRAILAAKDRPKNAAHLFVHADGTRVPISTLRWQPWQWMLR